MNSLPEGPRPTSFLDEVRATLSALTDEQFSKVTSPNHRKITKDHLLKFLDLLLKNRQVVFGDWNGAFFVSEERCKLDKENNKLLTENGDAEIGEWIKVGLEFLDGVLMELYPKDSANQASQWSQHQIQLILNRENFDVIFVHDIGDPKITDTVTRIKDGIACLVSFERSNSQCPVPRTDELS